MKLFTPPCLGILIAAVLAIPAHAATGLTEIPATAQHGAVTVFSPATGSNQRLIKTGLPVLAAPDAPPVKGNGRLIVISHGSGSTAWNNADLARELTEAGFIVALPTHLRDNFHNAQDAGPVSWAIRPQEVSSAIDALAKDARFAPLLQLDRVGMYGMSAGGLTALTLAGGRWSSAKMVQHCDAHIRADVHACVGLLFELNGGIFDSIKLFFSRLILRWRFNDPTWHQHHDPRIQAIVAGVPFGAVFDLNSLAQPKVPLALITARQDVWLHPQFHSDPILQVCQSCTRLHDFETGGHGALLSPIRSPLEGLVARLIGDPAGFDRQETARVNQKISQYFQQRLLP